MTSTYTTNKRIQKPAHNDFIDTWEIPVNDNSDILDTALGGKTSINVTSVSGTVVLTYTQYQPTIWLISGTLTANVNYQLPSGVGGFFIVSNAATGAFTVTISSGGAGTSQVITAGSTVFIYSDGTNIMPAVTTIANIQINDNNWNGAQLTVPHGGTGLTALNLNGALYASSTTTFTSGTLPVLGGGTGVTTSTGTGNVVLSASPTLTGNPVIPSPFTLGATSVTVSGTQLNYLASVTGVTGTSSSNLVFSASPTFTGTVTNSSGPFVDLIGNVREIPILNKAGSYTPTSADKNVLIVNTTGGITINTGVFSVNSFFAFYNNSGSAQTIQQGAGVTLTLVGAGTTGNRSVSAYGLATGICIGTDSFIVSGAGVA